MRKQLHGRAFVDGALREDVLVTFDENGLIDVAQTTNVPAAAERYEGVLVPGFIDVHVHGGDGADFMDADEEAVARILAFHGRHGTTALLATTLSSSPGDLRAAVDTIARTAGELRPGAEIAGIHLEGPYINPARAGAQDRGSIRPADGEELEQLIGTAPELQWVATVAPEADGVIALIERFRRRVTFSVGHTNASYAETTDALFAGASHFTHLYNAMTALQHREPGAVGAAFASPTATAELIADGIHVHPAALRIAVEAMPARIALVTDAMRACGLPEGSYRLYGYDVSVADGAARLADGTLAGSILTMDAAVRNMVELAGLPFEAVIPLATVIPARIAGVDDRKGRIDGGYDADLVLLSDRFEVLRVWARGVDVSRS